MQNSLELCGSLLTEQTCNQWEERSRLAQQKEGVGALCQPKGLALPGARPPFHCPAGPPPPVSTAPGRLRLPSHSSPSLTLGVLSQRPIPALILAGPGLPPPQGARPGCRQPAASPTATPAVPAFTNPGWISPLPRTHESSKGFQKGFCEANWVLVMQKNRNGSSVEQVRLRSRWWVEWNQGDSWYHI